MDNYEFTKLFRIKLDKHVLPKQISELGYEACRRLDATECSHKALETLYNQTKGELNGVDKPISTP